jgi:cytoskeletal protein CcmA (bactofilin family)
MRARGQLMLGKTPPPPPADSPARRFTDSVDAHVTVIGPGTRIKGELIADGPVELAGTLEGDIRVTAHCRVRQSAKVSGRVEAKTLVIEGTVEGPALVADKLEIGSSARVRSSIQARVMAIADGAIFEGEVRMDEAGSPQSFTEKRKA